MEIKQLISFEKIIELGSFTKAANYLGYTQSTITSHIQALENSLNVKLFEKVGRKNVLTTAGKELSIYAKELLQVVDKINHISEDSEFKGEIRIGAPEAITVYMLQPILKEYKERYPQVKIKLINSSCGYLKNLLLNGELDIAFLMMQEFEHPSLVVNKIREEKIVIVGNKDYDFSKLDLVSANNRINECMIYSEGVVSYRKNFEEYLASKEIVIDNIMELWSIEAIKQCVESGLGISILPEITVKDSNLQWIDFDYLDECICSLFVYNKNKWLSKPLSEFIAMCENIK